MVANITFLSFLLFSMCQSIRVAVNMWLNCSFFTLIIIIHEHYRCIINHSADSPVISTVAAAGGRINFITNQPGEPWVSIQFEARTSSSTQVATVGVHVTQDEDVACWLWSNGGTRTTSRVPPLLHSLVDIHQRVHLFQRIAWICTDAYHRHLWHGYKQTILRYLTYEINTRPSMTE